MADKQTTGNDDATQRIHTPGGMHRPSREGDAADGADIAATDMSVDPGGSRAEPPPVRAWPAVEELLDELDRLAASDSPALRDELAAVARRLREELGSTWRPFEQDDR